MRNSNVELLRFVLMVGICLLHTLFLGKNLGSFTSGIDRVDFFVVACVIPAVNVFMLISGYFGINTTIKKIMYFVLYGFIAYVLLFVIKAAIWQKPISMLGFVRNILPISTFVWWFFTYYFMIMLLAPFINKGCAVVSKKYFRAFILIYFLINSFGLYWGRISDGSNFQTLLFLYLVGRYVSIYNVKLNKYFSVTAYFACIAALCFIEIYFYERGTVEMCKLLYCYNNPLVVFASLSVLLFVVSFKPRSNPIFIHLGKHSFLIYLLTTMPFFSWWAGLYSDSIWICMLSILATCFLITIIDIPIVFFVNTCVRKLSATFPLLKD